MNIVSRGGSLLFAWMMMTGNENPFFEYYDEVLEILREYDVTISLGDALRPGCLADASDAAQISELIELGNLTKRAWEKDVQVMVEYLPYGNERDRRKYDNGKEDMPRRTFLCSRTSGNRYRTWL